MQRRDAGRVRMRIAAQTICIYARAEVEVERSERREGDDEREGDEGRSPRRSLFFTAEGHERLVNAPDVPCLLFPAFFHLSSSLSLSPHSLARLPLARVYSRLSLSLSIYIREEESGRELPKYVHLENAASLQARAVTRTE